MGFEYSNSTKEIREAHNQGHMKRKTAPLIDCDRKKLYRKKRSPARGDILKKFEIIFGEQFIAVISQISDPNPTEAIYLTIEYIYRILDLAPPKSQDKGKEHHFVYTFCWEKEKRDIEKSFYNQILWREGMEARRKNGYSNDLSHKQRSKALTKKEIKRVYENFPNIKPSLEIQKLTYNQYREHIFKCMQDCFNRLFSIWIQMGEYHQHNKDFTQEVSKTILERIKEPKNLNQCDKRIYIYIVQYLKDIAQKAIKARKLKLQIKDCVWNKEWISNLHFQDYIVEWEVLDDDPIWGVVKNSRGRIEQMLNINGYFVERLIQTDKKQYLGNNKEFENELLKYLKEIKEEYLKNNQK